MRAASSKEKISSPADYFWFDRVQLVLEPRHDAKVAATAANPQNRSAFCCSLDSTFSPFAMTTSTDMRLSMVMPYLRVNHPKPPPTVRPAIPSSS